MLNAGVSACLTGEIAINNISKSGDRNWKCIFGHLRKKNESD